MKKSIILGIVCLLVVCLTACACEHDWVEATCTFARHCSLCDTVEGEPLSHVWEEATCAAPKTCSACGATEGDALPHTWEEVTCAAPKTCSVCSATEGDALPHTWEEATYDAPKTCSVCAATEGEPLPPVGLCVEGDALLANVQYYLQEYENHLLFEMGTHDDGTPMYEVVTSYGQLAGITVRLDLADDGVTARKIHFYTTDDDALGLMAETACMIAEVLFGFDFDEISSSIQGGPTHNVDDGGVGYEVTHEDLSLLFVDGNGFYYFELARSEDLTI